MGADERLRPRLAQGGVWAAAIGGVAAVGWIDHLTGTDIHVVSLYFIPLAFAGARLGLPGAVGASILCTLVWLAGQYTTGVRYSEGHIWAINFFTQGAAFLTVGVLVARLNAALHRERMRSQTDALTGLRNHEAFIEQASQALALCRRHARPVALAYIDLDNFKRLNDQRGHREGDALLRRCGQLMAWTLRDSDIAARMGGDEFAVFLPETSAANAALLLERLRGVLESAEAFQAAGVTVSLGLCCDAAAVTDIAALIEQADEQMYAFKRSRKTPGP